MRGLHEYAGKVKRGGESMTIRTRGLIIRETDVSDYDKMMTVLTPDYGKISVFGRGIKRYTSPYFHAAQLFCYSDFLLYAKKQYYILNECECVESFFSLRDEIGALSLATYLGQTSRAISAWRGKTRRICFSSL